MIKKIYKASNAEQFHWGFRRSASWPTWFHSFSHSEIVYSSPTVCQAVWERELRPDQNVSFISDKKNSLKNVALDQGQDGLLIFHPWGLAKWVDNYSPFFYLPPPLARCLHPKLPVTQSRWESRRMPTEGRGGGGGWACLVYSLKCACEIGHSFWGGNEKEVAGRERSAVGVPPHKNTTVASAFITSQ